MKYKRMRAVDRRAAVLNAALDLAKKDNYLSLTRDAIAEAAGVSGPTVQHHFGSVANLRRELMTFAIRRKCLRVIAQGVACGDPQTMRLDPADRALALASV